MIQLVKDGKFREDLYYRINVFPIWVPPLRERLDDVPELALHFLARFAAEEGRRVTGISQEALELLTSYSWPGNVRQLENAMFRAIVLADGPQLTVAEFPQIAAHVEGFRASIPAAPAQVDRRPVIKGPVMLGAEDTVPDTMEIAPASPGGKGALGIPAVTDSGEIRSLEAMEADMIRLALGRYRGHMTEVAKRLGIGRSTLYRKMREFGLEERVG
jgi:DNA-binding NtrC family response regulator